MKVTVGDPRIDRQGRAGARVQIEIPRSEHGWAGVYHFETHGLSPADVAKRRNAIAQYHARKAARLTELSALWRTKTKARGVDYTVTDCTIRERGTDVELIAVAKTANGQTVKLRRVYPTPDDVPSAAEVVQLIADAAKGQQDAEDAKARHLDEVRRALEVQP